MKYWINKLKKLLHRHEYKPILSRYISFNTRDIIWECKKCGKRIGEREWKHYETPFSKETDYNVSYEFYQDVLNYKENVNNHENKH